MDAQYGLGHNLASRIPSGAVWINRHNAFDASLPLGGYKQSGWSREMGEEVFHNSTEVKAVTAGLSSTCVPGRRLPAASVRSRDSPRGNGRVH
jgi:hypothetical protein